MRKSIFFLVFWLQAFPISVYAKSLYWNFPQGGTQQDFARDEFECINAVKVVSQPKSQQQTIVVQQNNAYGNNTAIVNGAKAPTSFAGGMAESLSKSLATIPTTYVDRNMYKLCMKAKGYVEGQKPPAQKQLEPQTKIEFDRASRENKLKSDAAMAENKAKFGVVTLPNGIQYKVLEEGAGTKPNPNSTVDFHFSGTLVSGGQVFANTFANPKPVSGTLREIASLQGMLEVMQLMPTGAHWQVLLPPEKAWGNGLESLSGGPGPNQAILLDIKLISVK